MLTLTAVMLVTGCSSLKENIKEIFPDEDKLDYKKAKTTKPLDTPPDLTSTAIGDGLPIPDAEESSSATLSDFSRERQRSAGTPVRRNVVMPPLKNARIERSGNTQWLVVQGDPEQVWKKMREFWIEHGFLIQTEDPVLGILDTEWAESQKTAQKGFLGRATDSVLNAIIHTVQQRDKFHVRLDAGNDPRLVEVHIAHSGLEEVVTENSEKDAPEWKSRPSDPELEIEMLRRMAVYFGADENRSRTLHASKKLWQVDRAVLSDSGNSKSLRLVDDFSNAWLRTGQALGKIGYTIEDRDRSKGLYYVRYVDKEAGSSWTNKLKFWGDDEDESKVSKYLVNLFSYNSGTGVVILTEGGQPDTSKMADTILTSLYEELK